MSFAMKKYQLMGDGAFLQKIFKRTLLIFLIGYLLYWFPFFAGPGRSLGPQPISHTRILGVLERIALCNGFASLLIHYCKPKTVFTIAGILLLGYWAVLLLFPVREPTLQHDRECWLPARQMGDGRTYMYHGEGVAFDPEGILSTFPAIVNVIAGYFTGLFIQQKARPMRAWPKSC